LQGSIGYAVEGERLEKEKKPRRVTGLKAAIEE
jgi:hypothetical protein